MGTNVQQVIPAAQTLPVRPDRSETGVWVGIFAIVMTFAALTSAMIVRQGASPDWRHFRLPWILYSNTLVLLGSSLTLSLARRRLHAFVAALDTETEGVARSFPEGMTWLRITLALGALFVVGQALAWRILVAQGLFLSTNPSASFFYVFTAMHGLHLLGGIIGLCYMLWKLTHARPNTPTTGLPALCLYWHFMDGLWIYLLVLLMVRT